MRVIRDSGWGVFLFTWFHSEKEKGGGRRIEKEDRTI